MRTVVAVLLALLAAGDALAAAAPPKVTQQRISGFRRECAVAKAADASGVWRDACAAFMTEICNRGGEQMTVAGELQFYREDTDNRYYVVTAVTCTLAAGADTSTMSDGYSPPSGTPSPIRGNPD
jgi:hypothetical protein